MVSDSLISDYKVNFLVGRFDQTLAELLSNISNIDLSSYLVEETENHTYRIKSFQQLNSFIEWAGESAFDVPLMALPLDPVERVTNRNTSTPSLKVEQQLTEMPGSLMVITATDESGAQRVEAVLYNAEAGSNGDLFGRNFFGIFGSKKDEGITIDSYATKSKCSECDYEGLPKFDLLKQRWVCPNGHPMVYKT